MSEDFNAFRWVDIEEIRELLRGGEEEKISVEPIYRIISNLQGIFIVLYFFILTYFMEYEINILGIPPLIIKSIVMPVLLSLPWLIIHFGGIDIWPYVYKMIDVIMKRIGYFQRVFYLINAIILYLLIILPILTPIISIPALFLLIYYILLRIKNRKKKLLVSILFIPIYLLTLYVFLDIIFLIYFNFIITSLIPVFFNYWLSQIRLIYLISLMLASSAALGGFIRFIYEGAAKYDETISIPYKRIYIIQLAYIILTFYIIVFLKANISNFLAIVLSLSLVELFLRKIKGLSREKGELEELVGFVGWVAAIVFICIEILRNLFPFNPLVQMIPISIAGTTFLILFIYSYRKLHGLLRE